MMQSRLTTALYGLAILISTNGYVQAAETLLQQVEDSESSTYGPIYATADFWVAIGFIVFIASIARPVWRVVSAALDNKAAAIKAELDEAQRLREEAQHTLAEYQRKQRDTLAEAEAILTRARAEAERMHKATQEQMGVTLQRREQQALDMIAASEARAVADVRALTADVAIEATRRVLTDMVEGPKGDELINNAIREVPSKLN